MSAKWISEWTWISEEDRKEIEKYIDNTDVIITFTDEGKYRISTPQDDIRYGEFQDFMEDVRYNVRIMEEEGYI